MKIEYPDSGIAVWLCEIPSEPANLTLRRRERRAVEALIREAFGRDLPLGHSADGAPVLPVAASISISHCQGLAALAVGPEGARIGIDIETLRPQLRRVAPKFLSEAEQRVYGANLEGLVAAWTLTEAAYKAAGIAGLRLTTDIRLPLGGERELYVLGRSFSIVEVARPLGPARLSVVSESDSEVC